MADITEIVTRSLNNASSGMEGVGSTLLPEFQNLVKQKYENAIKLPWKLTPEALRLAKYYAAPYTVVESTDKGTSQHVLARTAAHIAKTILIQNALHVNPGRVREIFVIGASAAEITEFESMSAKTAGALAFTYAVGDKDGWDDLRQGKLAFHPVTARSQIVSDFNDGLTNSRLYRAKAISDWPRRHFDLCIAFDSMYDIVLPELMQWMYLTNSFHLKFTSHMIGQLISPKYCRAKDFLNPALGIAWDVTSSEAIMKYIDSPENSYAHAKKQMVDLAKGHKSAGGWNLIWESGHCRFGFGYFDAVLTQKAARIIHQLWYTAFDMVVYAMDFEEEFKYGRKVLIPIQAKVYRDTLDYGRTVPPENFTIEKLALYLRGQVSSMTVGTTTIREDSPVLAFREATTAWDKIAECLYWHILLLQHRHEDLESVMRSLLAGRHAAAHWWTRQAFFAWNRSIRRVKKWLQIRAPELERLAEHTNTDKEWYDAKALEQLDEEDEMDYPLPENDSYTTLALPSTDALWTECRSDLNLRKEGVFSGKHAAVKLFDLKLKTKATVAHMGVEPGFMMESMVEMGHKVTAYCMAKDDGAYDLTQWTALARTVVIPVTGSFIETLPYVRSADLLLVDSYAGVDELDDTKATANVVVKWLEALPKKFKQAVVKVIDPWHGVWREREIRGWRLKFHRSRFSQAHSSELYLVMKRVTWRKRPTPVDDLDLQISELLAPVANTRRLISVWVDHHAPFSSGWTFGSSVAPHPPNTPYPSAPTVTPPKQQSACTPAFQAQAAANLANAVQALVSKQAPSVPVQTLPGGVIYANTSSRDVLAEPAAIAARNAAFAAVEVEEPPCLIDQSGEVVNPGRADRIAMQAEAAADFDLVESIKAIDQPNSVSVAKLLPMYLQQLRARPLQRASKGRWSKNEVAKLPNALALKLKQEANVLVPFLGSGPQLMFGGEEQKQLQTELAANPFIGDAIKERRKKQLIESIKTAEKNKPKVVREDSYVQVEGKTVKVYKNKVAHDKSVYTSEWAGQIASNYVLDDLPVDVDPFPKELSTFIDEFETAHNVLLLSPDSDGLCFFYALSSALHSKPDKWRDYMQKFAEKVSVPFDSAVKMVKDTGGVPLNTASAIAQEYGVAVAYPEGGVLPALGVAGNHGALVLINHHYFLAIAHEHTVLGKEKRDIDITKLPVQSFTFTEEEQKEAALFVIASAEALYNSGEVSEAAAKLKALNTIPAHEMAAASIREMGFGAGKLSLSFIYGVGGFGKSHMAAKRFNPSSMVYLTLQSAMRSEFAGVVSLYHPAYDPRKIGAKTMVVGYTDNKNNSYVGGAHIEYVIIDEAYMVPLPYLMVYQRKWPNAKFILMGDPDQMRLTASDYKGTPPFELDIINAFKDRTGAEPSAICFNVTKRYGPAGVMLIQNYLPHIQIRTEKLSCFEVYAVPFSKDLRVELGPKDGIIKQSSVEANAMAMSLPKVYTAKGSQGLTFETAWVTLTTIDNQVRTSGALNVSLTRATKRLMICCGKEETINMHPFNLLPKFEAKDLFGNVIGGMWSFERDGKANTGRLEKIGFDEPYFAEIAGIRAVGQMGLGSCDVELKPKTKMLNVKSLAARDNFVQADLMDFVPKARPVEHQAAMQFTERRDDLQPTVVRTAKFTPLVKEVEVLADNSPCKRHYAASKYQALHTAMARLKDNKLAVVHQKKAAGEIRARLMLMWPIFRKRYLNEEKLKKLHDQFKIEIMANQVWKECLKALNINSGQYQEALAGIRNKTKYFLKTQNKAKSWDAAFEEKAGQGIMAAEKLRNFLVQEHVRFITAAFKECLNDNVKMAHGCTAADIAKFLMVWDDPTQTTNNGDVSQFDTTQTSLATGLIERVVIESFALSTAELFAAINFRMHAKLVCDAFATVIEDMRTSGEAMTFTFNTIVKMFLCVIMMPDNSNFICGVYGGDDDSERWVDPQRKRQLDLYKKIFLAEPKNDMPGPVHDFCNHLFYAGLAIYNPFVLLMKIVGKNYSTVLARESWWNEWMSGVAMQLRPYRRYPHTAVKVVQMRYPAVPQADIYRLFATLDAYSNQSYEYAKRNLSTQKVSVSDQLSIDEHIPYSRLLSSNLK